MSAASDAREPPRYLLALAPVMLALWAASADLPGIAGLCLRVSADAEPRPLVLLILAVPSDRLRHAGVWTGSQPFSRLPLVLADPRAFFAASAFTIVNEPSSALRPE